MFLDTGTRGILALAFFAALSCLVGSACTTALWLERSEQPGVVLSREVPIVVHVSDRVIELDDEGNVDALVDALEEGLIEKGFEFRIIGLKAEVDGGSARVPVYPGRLPLPRVELAVSAHDESVDRKTPLKIDCKILRADGRPIFTGVLGAPFAPRRAKTCGRALAQVILAHASL